MNLEALQTDFQRIVLDAECVGADWVSRSARGLSSRERLAIYHNAYRVRLIDVLLDTFEHTAAYLGDAWFRQLASDYVQAHQSTHANIGWYGQDFPQFLATHLADDRDVAELASMDWLLRRAFDSADGDVMTHDDLRRLAVAASDSVRLGFVPTFSVHTHCFNSMAIWQAIDADAHPPVAQRLPAPVDVAVWRKGHAPHFRTLTSIESVAMGCVTAGLGMDAIGAALERAFPDADVAREFGLILYRWVDDQVLAVAR